MRTNVIPQEKVRIIQKEALKEIANSVSRSFGPSGSYTAITTYLDREQNNISVKHTKDGHTIIKSLQFLHPIERSVQDLIVDMTRYITKEVGDGTTSAAILASIIFDKLCEGKIDVNSCPSDIISHFRETIKLVCERILSEAKECTLEDVYNICLISTNGNKELTDTLYQVYKKYGIDTYISLETSPREISIVKEYEGMALDTGFADNVFINDRSNNSARLQHPRIYAFLDPIDTPEMISYFEAIINGNILKRFWNTDSKEPQPLIPTVILCKKLSADISTYLEKIVSLMHRGPGIIPLLIVSDIHQDYLYEDIAQMCGARWIKKYIDPDVQKQDQENGLAPTIENIADWYGSAEEVRSDAYKTQFIRPKEMFNEDGSLSDKYNMMLHYLESQIDKATNEGASINEVATLKRRYNSFKGNMVDFLVGGISLSDREALKASVEDAIMNVRSSVINGVGYGANYMGLLAIKELLAEEEYKNDTFLHLLDNAYMELVSLLYSNSFPSSYSDIVDNSLKESCPYNIRTHEYDGKVLSSIRSDVVILETIDKILSMMFVTNQYLLPSVAINAYDNIEL